MGSKHDRVLLHNRNRLEEAKQVGIECEEMARDIKYNLRTQSDKLENRTLKNLFGIQRDMTKSNRLVDAIKKARFKNKLIMYGIVTLIFLSIVFILYVNFAGGSEQVVVHENPNSDAEGFSNSSTGLDEHDSSANSNLP